MSRVQWVFGTPNAKQDAVMKLRNRFIAYGGARGGGKSWMVRKWAILNSLRYKGLKVLIIRATYSELEKNHIRPMREETRGFARYKEQKKLLTFVNGSTIEFGYCANEKDMERYQGGEWDLIFIDEASNIPEECIKKFIPCVRGVNDFPKRTVYTLNPGGRSHHYFKRLFIDRDFREGENPDDYAFVQALVQDNVALMQSQPEYLKDLEALPEKLRKAWLEGRWDIFEGQFFEDFLATPDANGLCHVIDPFPPRPEWPIWHTYDYGRSKPFSVGWWTMDTDGVAYRIMEWYGCGKEPNTGLYMSAEEQFAEVARIEHTHEWLRKKSIRGWADPAIWITEGTSGKSIADVAASHGVYFDKGTNDRINGWAEFHNRLYFDEQGKSMFYVFANCKSFIRTIPTLVYDEHKVEDLDTEGEDHIADESRYFFVANPLKPRIRLPRVRMLPQNDPLEMYESTRKLMRRR